MVYSRPYRLFPIATMYQFYIYTVYRMLYALMKADIKSFDIVVIRFLRNFANMKIINDSLLFLKFPFLMS